MEDRGLDGIRDIVQADLLMVPRGQKLLGRLGELAMLHARPSASRSFPAPRIRIPARRSGQGGAEELQGRFLDGQFIHPHPARYVPVQETLNEIRGCVTRTMIKSKR